MKIVGVSNFNLETVSDVLVAENIQNRKFAETMCAAMNGTFSGDHAPRWYVIKEDDYNLYVFEP